MILMIKSNFNQENDISIYKNINELIKKCEAISLVTPTETHFDIAYKCIKANKHIFIEKPITKSKAEADRLIKSAQEKRKKL